MADLSIPEKAIERAARARYEAAHTTSLFGHKRLDWDSSLLAKARAREIEFARVELGAAAALIVAAELDRLAAYYTPSAVEDYDQAEENEREGVRSMCAALRFRASVLRGEGDPND